MAGCPIVTGQRGQACREQAVSLPADETPKFGEKAIGGACSPSAVMTSTYRDPSMSIARCGFGSKGDRGQSNDLGEAAGWMHPGKGTSVKLQPLLASRLVDRLHCELA
jgi:hypothetical protein